jgi:hypothetical protein
MTTALSNPSEFERAVSLISFHIDRVRVIRPQRYIGPQNSVEIRVIHGSVGGSLFIEKLAIEQSGEF